MDAYYFSCAGDEYAAARSAEQLGSDYEAIPGAEAARVLCQLPSDDDGGALARACEALGISVGADAHHLEETLNDALGWADAAVALYRRAPVISALAPQKNSAPVAAVGLSDLIPPELVSLEEHWLEIKVVDEAGEPVGGVRCVVELPDGGTRHARTDDGGVLYVDGVTQPGACKVRFPEMHTDTFEQA